MPLIFAAAAAGAINGFYGAAGGTVLLPLLRRNLKEDQVFPASLAIMTPICLSSLLFSETPLPIRESLPFLLASLAGGLISGKIRVKTNLLYKLFGILTLLGGGRLLWS